MLLLKPSHRIIHQKNKSPAQDLSPTIRPLSPIHIMSDSDQEFPDNASQIPAFNSDATLHPMLSEPGPSLSQRSPSPLLRHSGRNRKLIKKAESQHAKIYPSQKKRRN